MLAHRVDLVNRSAGIDQQTIQLLEIFKADVGIEGQLDERRAATGEQKKYQRAGITSQEQIDDGAGGGYAAIVGDWVSRTHGAKSSDSSGDFSGDFGEAFMGRDQNAFK